MVVGSGWEVIMEKKKIFIIVENHELLEGIAQQFEKFSNYQIVGTANRSQQKCLSKSCMYYKFY